MKRTRGHALRRRYGRGRGYSSATQALIARYRNLVRQQRGMPSGEQWKMGPALREAKAQALVAISEEEAGLR